MAFSDRSPIDVWRDAYQETWFALKTEGRSPRHVIADWADVKPSTAGAWKRGDCTPDGPTMIRLARNACRDGYKQLAALNVDGSHRIADVGESMHVTGSLTDNLRDLDMIESDLWNAAENGDPDAIKEIGKRLHQEADEVIAEASHVTNGKA